MRFPSFDALRPYTYALLRIGMALMFMQHGAQLFGALGGFGPTGSVPIVSKFGVAGIIEFAGGLLIAVGILTRPIAWIAVIEIAWLRPRCTSARLLPDPEPRGAVDELPARIPAHCHTRSGSLQPRCGVGLRSRGAAPDDDMSRRTSDANSRVVPPALDTPPAACRGGR
jgi:hypothetical protein